jgi:lipid-A-disaccharide synthase-like uncharacterized protein
MSWIFGWFTDMTAWKALGIFGQIVFGSRFFVQWWVSERAGRSVIPEAFWYISIVGGLITMVYAFHIEEPVFLLPQIAALAVYGRNLHLVRREQRERAASRPGPAG